MKLNEEKIIQIISEELTKTEVKDMIKQSVNSKEFKEKVKEISAKVIEELYKVLWTRKSFWADSIKN